MSSTFRSFNVLKHFLVLVKRKLLKQKNVAAFVIQRAFRHYLCRKDQRDYIHHRSAILIQRAWRNYYIPKKLAGNANRKNNEINIRIMPPSDAPTSPRVNRRKVLIEIEPKPQKNQKGKLSQDDLDKQAFEHEYNVKWIEKSITTSFVNSIMKTMDLKAQIISKNTAFGMRQIPRAFFINSIHDIFYTSEVVCAYFHAPTFRCISVHKSGITLIDIDADQMNPHYYPMNIQKSIIDSTMDPRSGRVFLLFNDWTMSVFENGFFSRNKPVQTTRIYQDQAKYVKCDKYGHLWLLDSTKRSTVFLLDSLDFFIMSEKRICLPKQNIISNFCNLYRNNNPEGFLFASTTTPDVFLYNNNGEYIDTLSFHSSKSPKIHITKEYIITYGNDMLINVYSRSEGNVAHLKTIVLNSKPISVTFMRGFQLLVVGLSNASICFFTLNDETYPKSIPISSLSDELSPLYSEIIGDNINTKLFRRFSLVFQQRVNGRPKEIYSTQYSTDCTLLILFMEDNQIETLFMIKFSIRVKTYLYDIIKYPPIYSSPKAYCSRQSYEDLLSLKNPIKTTRQQLMRDSEYLKQIHNEIEKRFLLWRFKIGKEHKIGEIMIQSPFRRWIRYLSPFFPNLSIYELFWLLRPTSIMIPTIDCPKKLNMALSELIHNQSSEMIGKYSCIVQTSFNKIELDEVISILSEVNESSFSQFSDFRDTYFQIKSTLPSLYFKSQIREFNDKIIYRISEIENIIKNTIKTIQHAKDGNKVTFGIKRGKKLKVPAVYPETTFPFFSPKLVGKSTSLLPDPLYESFRYKNHRDIHLTPEQISYCKYSDESNTAEILPLSTSVSIKEITYSRALSKYQMCNHICSISSDNRFIVQHYPHGKIPLSYILVSNPFCKGTPNEFLVARYWLSQILVLLSVLHKQSIVLRSCLPSNFILSPDGAFVQISSLADSYFQDSDIVKLPFVDKEPYWLPPEYWANHNPTPAFDIYQFGILVLYLMTGFRAPSFVEIIKNHTRFRQDDILDIAKSPRFFYDPLEGFSFSRFPFFTSSGEALYALLEIDSPSSLYDIVLLCLDMDPSRRPTARQLLNHPFFYLTPSTIKRAQTLALSQVLSVPLSVFVNGVFGTLISRIEYEFQSKCAEIPSIDTAVNVLSYFLNKSNNKYHIKFPISDLRLHQVVEEVFEQHIFDQIVVYVIKRLRQRFENGEKVINDEPFLSLISLYHQFFKSCLNTPSVFSKVFPSFKKLSTGIDGYYESHELFTFLHMNMRPLVQFFFTKVSPSVHRMMNISEFYCQHFMEFYDNMRDFAMAFEERSERRHASTLNFVSTFIEAYPCEDTMNLLLDFGIQHKIEHSLAFQTHLVRFSSLKLLRNVLHFPFLNLRFLSELLLIYFPYLIISETQPYPEKILLIEILRELMFSKSFVSILSLLNMGLLDILFEISGIHPEKAPYIVWGQGEEVPIYKISRELISDLCRKSIPIIRSLLFSIPEIRTLLNRIGIPDYLEDIEFTNLVQQLEINSVSDSLLSTMLIAESSSLSTITSITQQTEQSFQSSLVVISSFLIRNQKDMVHYNNLFRSLLYIWQNNNLSVYIPLIESILNGFRDGYQYHQELLVLILRVLKKPSLPDVFLSIPSLWNQYLQSFIKHTKTLSRARSVPDSFLVDYPRERSNRMNLLRSLLDHPDTRLSSLLSVQCDFANLVINEMLVSTEMFEIKFKVVPSEFVKYNRRYLIRNEAISFLRIVLSRRIRADSLFSSFSGYFMHKNILLKEAKLLKNVNEKGFRLTTIRLLNTLASHDDAFGINEIILKSDILMALKEESLNDWENFQMLQNAWDTQKRRDNTGILEKVRCLYDSLK